MNEQNYRLLIPDVDKYQEGDERIAAIKKRERIWFSPACARPRQENLI